MAKTLLQIVNQVQGSLGLPQSTSIVGNTSDFSAVQMLNLMNELVVEVRREYKWTVLQWEFIIQALPAVTVTGNLTAGSGVVTNVQPNTTGLLNYLMAVSAPSVPSAARIQSVDSSSQFTMNMAATTAATAASIVVAQDTYPMPADFDYLHNRTMWDRTNRWELLGPDSAQMDQWHKSGIVVTGPRRHFRKFGPYVPGGQFYLWPPPFDLTANLQLVFEYISTNCIAKGGNLAIPTTNAYTNTNFVSQWASDSDVSLLDDDILIKGLKYKYYEAKGFNYADKKNEFIDYMAMIWSRDGGRGTLSLAKKVHPIFISPANVQDGFFPGPVGPNSV